MHAKSLQSCLILCDPMDCSQAPLSMGFSRKEYWSGLPFPSPGYLPNPVIKLRSPTLEADFLLPEPREAQDQSSRHLTSTLVLPL